MNINLSAIQIKPITNDLEFEEAAELINALVDADLIDDPIERKKALDLLEAIAILAAAYEQKRFPMPEPKPRDIVLEAIAQLRRPPKKLIDAWISAHVAAAA